VTRTGSGEQALGSAAQEAARLVEALSDWLAVRARDPDGFQFLSEHVATGAPECRLCPLCRLIALGRSAGPEVAGHLDDALRSLGAVLRLAAESMGAEGIQTDPGKGFETIVIN